MRANRRRHRLHRPAIKLSAAVPQIDQQVRKVAEIAVQILGKEGRISQIVWPPALEGSSIDTHQHTSAPMRVAQIGQRFNENKASRRNAH
jgi:hypothetical protein